MRVSLLTHSVLVVDDDRRLRVLLEKYLSQNGYIVSIAEDVNGAEKILESEEFSIMILDVMMPGVSGIDFCKNIRSSKHAYSSIPILILTALGDPAQRVQGLEAGADDYVTKPFEPKELLMRMEKIISKQSNFSKLFFGDFEYDTISNTLFKSGEPVFLTSMESTLLETLCKSPRQVVPRGDLSQTESPDLTSRTVDVQITRLRKKIEKDPSQPVYIRTIRNQGYAIWPDRLL
jgi:two-component system phosphate regulon response regulator OmpR